MSHTCSSAAKPWPRRISAGSAAATPTSVQASRGARLAITSTLRRFTMVPPLAGDQVPDAVPALENRDRFSHRDGARPRQADHDLFAAARRPRAQHGHAGAEVRGLVDVLGDAG